jgi:hypothetical protein
MSMAADNYDGSRLESDFERAAVEGDDTAAREMLAAGLPIHVARGDTPPGYVVRIHPDGHEELVRVDRDAAAQILGR